MRRNILHKTSKLAETNDQTVNDDKKANRLARIR